MQQEFSTTRWTLIERLQGDEIERAAAMRELAELYWAAVYTFYRRLGEPKSEAADLTQGFFETVILQRGLLDSAERSDGRLRALIKSAARHFQIDAKRKEIARERVLKLTTERLEAEERSLNGAGGNAGNGGGNGVDAAEQAFDRRWYLAVLQEAVRRVDAHFGTDDRSSFSLFERMILYPSLHGTETPVLAEAADALGFPSAAAASSALYRIRKRMLATLHEVINETVRDPRDKAAEFEAFLRAVRTGD